ncbi:MAG TPA: type I secretion system permease/ATPase [Xanthobacteraceae bacterium]|nr:type I secretion system permease/ATPase [Xanthobacteraceae bacterium]
MGASNPSTSKPSPIAIGLSASRGAFAAVGILTGLINMLMLTGSFFMLQVYDRVLPSRSVPTLLALGALAAALYAFQGFLDMCRGRILVRIACFLDEKLSTRIYQAVATLPLKTQGKADGLQPVRDLDQIRGFMSGAGPTALFDMPWIPLYLGICFAFHIWIGLTAIAGAIVLVSLTLWTEVLTRAPAKAAAEANARRLGLAETTRRNAEVLQAMGMRGRLTAAWANNNEKFLTSSRRAADVAGGIGSASRVLRMLLQSIVLGVGAYLAIKQEATAGIIIASSILVSRALAPVELSIANWKGFVAARQSRRRLSDLLNLMNQEQPAMQLPPPRRSLSVEALSVAPPGQQQRITVHDASFTLESGQGLGIIGPSAAGKSSLARGIVGVWAPTRGKVRLDGAALEQWSSEGLGPHIGYLPQDVELFDGTVAENIARFTPDPNPESIIAAAHAAGVHDLIVRLPDGYETRIGENGTAISAGQRQRIALARALYGDPFLVVLDEPNSNLDAEGDEALTQAILKARERGAVVIVIAHRPSALLGVDLILAIANGRVQTFGPKEEVLQKVLDRTRPHLRAVKVASEGEVKP